MFDFLRLKRQFLKIIDSPSSSSINIASFVNESFILLKHLAGLATLKFNSPLEGKRFFLSEIISKVAFLFAIGFARLTTRNHTLSQK